MSDTIINHYRHPSWLTNTYLVRRLKSSEAILIDAGTSPDDFEQTLLQENITVSAIFVTHHHRDHVQGLLEWIDFSSAKVYAQQETARELDLSCIEFESRATWNIAGMCIEGLHTPGHTLGHACFLLDQEDLFTGDLIFRGSVGGTVAPGHSTFEDLKQSTLEMCKLPAKTRIWPGHMNPTSVEHELATNTFIQAWVKDIIPPASPCKVRGQKAELLIEGADYDGGTKLWIRYLSEDRKYAIVPGSWKEG